MAASVVCLYGRPRQSPVCLCVSSLGAGWHWLLFAEYEGDKVPSDWFPGNSWDPHIGPEAWKEGKHSKHHTHFTNAESRLKMPHDETKQPQWVSAGAEPRAQAFWLQSPFLAIKPHQALGLGGSGNCPQVHTIQVETKIGLIHRKNYLPKIYSLSMPCSYKNWRWPLSLSLSKRTPLEGDWVRPGTL